MNRRELILGVCAAAVAAALPAAAETGLDPEFEVSNWFANVRASRSGFYSFGYIADGKYWETGAYCRAKEWTPILIKRPDRKLSTLTICDARE